MTKTSGKDFVGDMFNQAAEGFNKAMETGVKVQEEFFRAWTRPFNGATDEAREGAERLATDWIPVVTKNVAELQKSFDADCKAGMDLMHQAFEASRGTTPSELQEKTQELWKTTFDTVRQNNERMAKLSTTAMENWAGFWRESCNGHDGKNGAKTAGKK